MVPYPFVNIIIAGTDKTPPAVEIVRYDKFVLGLIKPDSAVMMKLHMALGAAGEVGELADAIKKEIIYNKSADRENIVEELGDIQWYLSGIMSLYDITYEEIFQGNANKLSKRYVNLKYSDKEAIDRADKK